MSWSNCDACNGCTDDRCSGCGVRWCGGTYGGEDCDRCPEKVDKQITDDQGNQRVIRVRCNGDAGHRNGCHWDPRHAGAKSKIVDLTDAPAPLHRVAYREPSLAARLLADAYYRGGI